MSQKGERGLRDDLGPRNPNVMYAVRAHYGATMQANMNLRRVLSSFEKEVPMATCPDGLETSTADTCSDAPARSCSHSSF